MQPTFLYDGDCGWCTHWISKWQKITGDKIAFAPYQHTLRNFPQVTKEQCALKVQLIMPDGKIYSGAHAILKTLNSVGHSHQLLWLYEHSGLVRWMSEGAYAFIARHRHVLSKIYRTPECKL